MPALPRFTQNGVLPEGEYPLTIDELAASMLVVGAVRRDDDEATWDSQWRAELVRRLRVMVEQLWAVGIEDIFVDGSFAEAKDHPNDIDGYFVCDAVRFASGRLEEELNRIDPAKCWTWNHESRRPYRGYPKLQLPMWHVYRVELYPHYSGHIAGVDEIGNALEFPAFFRKCRRQGVPKGIIRILKA